MEYLNFIWQLIYNFFGQQDNLLAVLWGVFIFSWLAIAWQLLSLPYKLRKVKREWERQHGLFCQGDAFYIRVKKIKF